MTNFSIDEVVRVVAMSVPDTQTRPGFWTARWGVALPIALAYWASLPSTVQTLDSGDMVSSAWGLTVPHAPGYPLYVWGYHLFLNAFPLGTVFHRAALLTSLCAVGTVLLLLSICRNWIGVAAIAAMATLTAVWRYAVLPDVFGLHLLLCAALIAVAFSRLTAFRSVLAPLLFGLGAANHHSVLFMAPLMLLVSFEDPNRWRAALGLVAGAMVTVALYASLLLLDVEHVNSFGDLTSVDGLLHHFLRRDYGTFKLAAYGGPANVADVAKGVTRAVGAFGLAAVALIVSGAVGAIRDRQAAPRRPWWALLSCLGLYLTFFVPQLNLGATYLDGPMVLERFFLFPMLLAGALVATASVSAIGHRWIRYGVVGALTGIAVVQSATGEVSGLRRDVVVEQYARNLLTTASRHLPAILMVDSDTKFFACRYVQATEPGYEDVFIVTRSMVFDRRLLEHAKKRWPRLAYDAEAVRLRKNLDIFTQFLAPNMDAFTITHVMPFTSPRGKTTVFPLGRGLEAGSGYVIADVPRFQPNFPVYEAESSAYVDTKGLFAEYARYDLARGQALRSQGDRAGAREAFLDGLKQVPYCIPCLRSACELTDDGADACHAVLVELERSEYDYFK